MNKNLSGSDRLFMNIVNIFAIFVIIVCFYPIWNIFILSILTPEQAMKGGLQLIPTSFDLSAYKNVLSSPEIIGATYNSFWRVIVGTLATVILTTLVSYPLSKREEFPGYKFWMTFIIITLYFSGGLIPTYLAYKSLHLLNNGMVLVLPGAIAAYNVIMTRNFLRSLPASLEESAKIDGATDINIWIKIVLPLSTPIMATVALWTAVAHWNAFFDALIYMTDRKKYVLQIILRRMLLEGEVNMFVSEAVRDSQSAQAVSPPAEQLKAAFIMVCTLPILMVYPFAQKYFVKGIMVGAVKG